MILLLFLCACSSPQCPEWELESVKGSCPSYHSSRMTYVPDGLVKKMEMEVIRASYGERVYIHLFSRPAPAGETVAVSVNGTQLHALRMEGGQTLLLQDADAQNLIETLLSGIHIELSLRGYQGRIEASNFAKLYDEML